MSELINQNVFADSKKFIDFSGLQHFWTKTKGYVDTADSGLSGRITVNENAIKAINEELTTLSGGVGSVGTQINNAIAALKLPETYEAKGAAATAEGNANAYADGLVKNEDGTAKFDAAGTAAGLNDAMDARVVKLEAIDHDKIAADAAAAAVAGVIDEAPESFDTLKEVAAWIANNDHASDVAGLVTDVENLKKIDHDAYVAADATVLANAKAYTDGLVLVDGVAKFEAAGAAAQALTDAKKYADDNFQVKGNYEAAGTAASAIAALKLADTYEAKGAAADAQAAAIAQAKLDAAEALKGYYTKGEVDNLLSTNSTGDRAYAKQYTDELFGSFKFAENSEIDALFA